MRCDDHGRIGRRDGLHNLGSLHLVQRSGGFVQYEHLRREKQNPGKGKPLFFTPGKIRRIILQGLTGPITVNGKEWDSTMLPPGVTDSRDLANLLTFLRRQFGGVEKAAYTPKQVDAIRRDL